MNNELKVSGIVLSGIISALVLIPLFGADTTIFLTTENGGTPVSCAPANGLVLAQNITDLCDVTIINATSGQIIEYNGTQWVNVNSTTFSDTTVCNNLGSGAIICAGGNVDLKSLIEGSGIDITSNGTTITIASTVSGESTTASNRGIQICDSPTIGDECIAPFAGQVGNDLQFYRLSSVDECVELFNFNATYNAIDFDCSWSGTNLGSSSSLSEGIYTSNNGNILQFKRLLEGTAITLSSNSTHITITNAGVTSLTSANNAIALSGSTGSITITPKMELLCQTTLVSNNATISCNDFPARTNIIISLNARSTGGTGIEPALRFNHDSGNNYAVRTSANGASDATITNTSRCNLGSNGGLSPSTDSIVSSLQFNNFSSDRKIGYGYKAVGADSADTTAPSKVEISCKWDNTTDQITSITMISFSGTGSFNTGSILTVWGYD